MKEYFTPGVVLERRPRGELDETVTVYTKNLGKVAAFTKSSRKITSKLSGHLIPGKLAQIRLVEKNKIQLVDILAVKSESEPKNLLPFLNFLNQITPYNDADLNLWYMIEEIVQGGHFNPSVYRHLLLRMGFISEEASCDNCRSKMIEYLILIDTTLLCSDCFTKTNLKADEFIFLGKK